MKIETIGARGRGAVRPRADRDLAACVRVLAQVHAHDGYPVNWPDRPGEWLSRPGGLGAWVAELDGGIVGHVGLSRAEPDDVAPALWRARHGGDGDAAAVVSRLFVAPHGRGHGFGARLMACATREAERRGLRPVLDVVATDAAAVALYERLGWEPLGTSEQRWGPDRTVSVRSYAAADTSSERTVGTGGDAGGAPTGGTV
ncbi:GNAT family N-acetyltransferase [Streptomyces fructofermentans]|uniref:GNAT family N-acetyltransferase n=1 Tax=Streptomyces fructofermentans TaxID=152141 RepID=UPI0037BBBF07